jgi:adenylylsulfate kinase
MKPPAFAVWLTGLPASGKSTIARALHLELCDRGIDAALLESDALRPVLTPDPDYSETGRDSFYRALGCIGAQLVAHGVPVIFDATANRRAYRMQARTAIERFIEVFVECPLDVCMARDPKGIYRSAHAGQATSVPGLQTSYERPEHPDLIVSGVDRPAEESARAIVNLLERRSYIGTRHNKEDVMAEKTTWESIKAEGESLLEKVKQLIHEGNVRRVVIQHQGRSIAEFPLTAGVVGVALAPVLAAIGAVVALVKDCTIEVERIDQDEKKGTGTTG